jgi:hypothetical protein
MAWLLEVEQYITVQGIPSGRKEHPVIKLPFVVFFFFRVSYIFSTDMGGDRSATIIWACLSFFLRKVNSQGFDSTTTSPNCRMLVATRNT